MNSVEVCTLIEQGIHHILPEITTIKVPIADGGEGTVDAFLTAAGGQKITARVKDPLFREINAYYGILADHTTAIIEMATASGLPLVEHEKNPRLTTTYGTGQLIVDALNRGCRKIIIGIGGSATNDGGIGMAAALGVKFLDADGQEIPLNGQGLERLRSIDLSHKDPRIDQCEISVACDVDNPLYGEKGAAYIFGPQKGADPAMVKYLDQNLQNYAAVLQRVLNINVQQIPGSGAAGGLGAGLLAFTPAQLKSGIDIILDYVGFNEIIANAHLIITGEGKIDGQSLRGKVPVGIAGRAKQIGIPVIAMVGDIGEDTEAIYEKGIQAILSINRVAVPFEKAKVRSREDLLETAKSLARILQLANW